MGVVTTYLKLQQTVLIWGLSNFNRNRGGSLPLSSVANSQTYHEAKRLLKQSMKRSEQSNNL